MKRFLCRIGLHQKRMRYVGDPRGEGFISGATHFVYVCGCCGKILGYGGAT